jgi:hypothetical protein
LHGLGTRTRGRRLLDDEVEPAAIDLGHHEAADGLRDLGRAFAVGVDQVGALQHIGEERHHVAIEDRDAVLLHRAGEAGPAFHGESTHGGGCPRLPAAQHPEH